MTIAVDMGRKAIKQTKNIHMLLKSTCPGYIKTYHARFQRGGQGVWNHLLKNRKAIWFLSITGPDPLKTHKDTKPSLNKWPSSAFQRNAISI